MSNTKTCLSTSNPRKSHTTNVGQEHISGNWHGQKISHYASNGYVLQDKFPLRNYISNMTKNKCLRARIAQWLLRSFANAKAHVLSHRSTQLHHHEVMSLTVAKTP